MVRLSWADTDVEYKINALPLVCKQKAKVAFKHLMCCETSMYKSFVNKHRKFFKTFPEASPEQRKRPLQMIEERGVECTVRCSEEKNLQKMNRLKKVVLDRAARETFS
eukprot:3733898-Amphidinium_carterae.2